MKKILLTCLLSCTFALPVSASMNSDFSDNFTANGLAAYNRDIASLIGQADFHTAEGTSFPGFDVGATASVVKTSDDSFSRKDYFIAPFVTAETQLPFLGMGVAVRGTSYDGFDSLGGGLRWHQSIALVSLSAAAFYDHYKTDYYNGDHYSASVSASVDAIFVTPFIGVGYDYSRLDVKNSAFNSHDDAMRYTAGINVHPFPLVYLFGAYTYTKDNHGFQAGLGLNF